MILVLHKDCTVNRKKHLKSNCVLKKRTSQPIFTLQGKKFVSIVPKPESEDATAPNMFKSLAGGLKSDKKCRKVRDGMQ